MNESLVIKLAEKDYQDKVHSIYTHLKASDIVDLNDVFIGLNQMTSFKIIGKALGWDKK